MLRVRITGVDEEIASMQKQVTEQSNALLRAQAFQLYAHLKQVTPVDTGRARNSWYLSYEPGQFKDNMLPPPPATPPVFVDGKEVSIYITNGVPYIEDLNAGSSRQASARFIENTVAIYF